LLVRDVIDELRAGGATVFLNSHLLGEVEATCDRVAFVKSGRVVHELELASAAGTLDVELRVGPIDDALLDGLAAFGTGITRDDALVRMHASAESVLPEIARWLVGRGAALYELRCRRKTLEEWFVEVMGEDQRPG
jgi:ABC-2 type transport system ATP-binding protein